MKEHLDRKRLKAEKRAQKADMIIKELAFATLTLSKLQGWILESSKFKDQLEGKRPETYSINDVAGSISVLSMVMTPDEVLRFAKLYEEKAEMALGYLMAVYFHEVKKYQDGIIEHRKQISGWTFYFSEDVVDRVSEKMEEFYRVIDDIDFENVKDDYQENMIGKLEPIAMDIRDILLEEMD